MHQKPWREEYLRVLLHGPASPDDYPIAVDLINKGLAEGNILPNRSVPGTVANLRWIGITLAGRAYAEKLQGQIKRDSWLGKLLLGASSIAGATALWFWQEILNGLKHLILGL